MWTARHGCLQGRLLRPWRAGRQTAEPGPDDVEAAKISEEYNVTVLVTNQMTSDTGKTGCTSVLGSV